METNDNPYATHRTAFEIVPSTEPRIVSYGVIAFVGMAVGGVSFLVSLALIPSDVSSLSDHDLRLANHLGFIYPPIVGLWASWVRRSLPWAIFGIISGLLIGVAYYELCDYNFFSVMIGFPCLLGGCTSVLMGTKHNSWFEGIPRRFLKGLAAGLVLGFVYAVLLNVFAAFMISGFNPSVADYSSMMWRAGTIAMAIGSSLYFILFHWSAGLHPRTLNANEPSDAPKTSESSDQ